MKALVRWLVVLVVTSIAACSCDDGASHTPVCVADHFNCGNACSSSSPCGIGAFCGPSGVCEQACSQTVDCENGAQCIALSGECPGRSDGGGGIGGAGGSGGECPDTTVTANKINPVVILVVDQSSSMNQDFEGNTSRWDALRGFLLESGGLIEDLQSQVQFGLAMYSARAAADTGPAEGECPVVTSVAPARDNYAAIAGVYNAADPIDETPTGDSIDKIIADLDLENRPDQDTEPVVLILATDGEPDTCEQANPQQGQAESIAAVERAFDLGVRTFIISVGNEVSAGHQQDVANAGLGRGPSDPEAEFWVAGDDQSLRDALTDIVGAQLGCEIALEGNVQGDACLGTVLLNGAALTCNGNDGWVLTDPSHIRLQGSACDTLKSDPNVLLTVTFPCDVPVGPL